MSDDESDASDVSEVTETPTQLEYNRRVISGEYNILGSLHDHFSRLALGFIMQNLPMRANCRSWTIQSYLAKHINAREWNSLWKIIWKSNEHAFGASFLAPLVYVAASDSPITFETYIPWKCLRDGSTILEYHGRLIANVPLRECRKDFMFSLVRIPEGEGIRQLSDSWLSLTYVDGKDILWRDLFEEICGGQTRSWQQSLDDMILRRGNCATISVNSFLMNSDFFNHPVHDSRVIRFVRKYLTHDSVGDNARKRMIRLLDPSYFEGLGQDVWFYISARVARPFIEYFLRNPTRCVSWKTDSALYGRLQSDLVVFLDVAMGVVDETEDPKGFQEITSLFAKNISSSKQTLLNMEKITTKMPYLVFDTCSNSDAYSKYATYRPTILSRTNSILRSCSTYNPWWITLRYLYPMVIPIVLKHRYPNHPIRDVPLELIKRVYEFLSI